MWLHSIMSVLNGLWLLNAYDENNDDDDDNWERLLLLYDPRT